MTVRKTKKVSLLPQAEPQAESLHPEAITPEATSPEVGNRLPEEDTASAVVGETEPEPVRDPLAVARARVKSWHDHEKEGSKQDRRLYAQLVTRIARDAAEPEDGEILSDLLLALGLSPDRAAQDVELIRQFDEWQAVRATADDCKAAYLAAREEFHETRKRLEEELRQARRKYDNANSARQWSTSKAGDIFRQLSQQRPELFRYEFNFGGGDGYLLPELTERRREPEAEPVEA